MTSYCLEKSEKNTCSTYLSFDTYTSFYWIFKQRILYQIIFDITLYKNIAVKKRKKEKKGMNSDCEKVNQDLLR